LGENLQRFRWKAGEEACVEHRGQLLLEEREILGVHTAGDGCHITLAQLGVVVSSKTLRHIGFGSERRRCDGKKPTRKQAYGRAEFHHPPFQANALRVTVFDNN